LKTRTAAVQNMSSLRYNTTHYKKKLQGSNELLGVSAPRCPIACQQYLPKIISEFS